MKIVCLNCGQKQLDNKLHYCTFCFKPFYNSTITTSRKTNESLNNLKFSSTRKIEDNGTNLTITLKPLKELILDNIFSFLFFEILLFILIHAILFFIAFAFRFYYYHLDTLLFIMINISIYLIKKGLTEKIVITETKYTASNIFKVKEGLKSDLESIAVIKSLKVFKGEKYQTYYSLTFWEVNFMLKNGEKLFLNKFVSDKNDEGSESRRLSFILNENIGKEGEMVVDDSITSYRRVEKDVLKTIFWSDSGQLARNFVLRLSERLNLEIEYYDITEHDKSY